MRRFVTRKILCLLFLLYFLFDAGQVHQYRSIPPRQPISRTPERRVYVASQFWNSEDLLRTHWNEAILALAKRLGPHNVYVAIYESGSWDNSKGALRELDAMLKEHEIDRQIILSNDTHLSEMSRVDDEAGWVLTPEGRRQRRRISYLADVRNKMLEHLQRLAQTGLSFDTVLFLGDVVFTTEDVLRLLDTNGGQFAAACALDFDRPPKLYDTFALRDAEGHEAIMQTWPYFRAWDSRHAAMAGQPIPVSSCWNGMVAMRAEPFVASRPLRFRAIEDSLAAFHVEESECCLIHVDNPLSSTEHVYVNPHVQVAYSVHAYEAVHSEDILPSSLRIFKAIWKNRFIRWTTPSWVEGIKIWIKVTRWRRQSESNEEAGRICLVGQMQILIEKGWAHV